MKRIKVGVAGYGVIGQRLADGVAMQGDMELVGIADLAPTLSIRALREKDMVGENGVKYNLYLVDGADKAGFNSLDIPTSGSMEDLVKNVDIMLDSAPGGVGVKNKELYVKYGRKAVFQGGEKNSVADVFAEGEPSAQQLATLVDYCRAHQVTTIFSEALVSTAVSVTLASEVGAEVKAIYTMASTENGKSYLERMERNLNVIYESLK